MLLKSYYEKSYRRSPTANLVLKQEKKKKTNRKKRFVSCPTYNLQLYTYIMYIKQIITQSSLGWHSFTLKQSIFLYQKNKKMLQYHLSFNLKIFAYVCFGSNTHNTQTHFSKLYNSHALTLKTNFCIIVMVGNFIVFIVKSFFISFCCSLSFIFHRDRAGELRA